MKKLLGLYCLFVSGTMDLFAWEDEPKLAIEGVFREAQRNRTTRYPDGTEESTIEKRTVLVTDEPVILSKSFTLANNQVVLQQESLAFLRVGLGDEFLSLIGKKVKVYGNLIKPLDFFFSDDVELDVDTALDCEWMQTHQPTIVSYEPNTVQLIGKIYDKTYPGPPEYMSVEKGDRSETVMILALSEPIDVEASTEDDFNETERGVREIQVVFLESAPPKHLWNQRVILSGSLFHAHTGHHRRRVLMMTNHWEIDLPVSRVSQIFEGTSSSQCNQTALSESAVQTTM